MARGAELPLHKSKSKASGAKRARRRAFALASASAPMRGLGAIVRERAARKISIASQASLPAARADGLGRTGNRRARRRGGWPGTVPDNPNGSWQP